MLEDVLLNGWIERLADELVTEGCGTRCNVSCAMLKSWVPFVPFYKAKYGFQWKIVA